MINDIDGTIAAIASAPGSSLRGVIRISGYDSLQCVRHIVGSDSIPERRRPFCRCLEWPIEPTGATLPVQILCWPTERSFTRQPSVEIHTIGSMPILQMILDQLMNSGCRLAEAGEFTMRAFLNGRLDLVQAEAVLGVIDARNQKEFGQALEQLAGGIAGPIHEIRDLIISLLAELEAGLDFVEEDIEFISQVQLTDQLQRTIILLEKLVAQIDSRQSHRQNSSVVLVGPANAGKSSLFNCLTGSQAIVSSQPGTTRDYLVANLDLDGVRAELVDTAGLLGSSNLNEPIDEKTRVQSLFAADNADVLVVCQPIDQPEPEVDIAPKEFGCQETIHVTTKSDLAHTNSISIHTDAISTSTKTGQGIDQLRTEIKRRIEKADRTDSNATCTIIRTRGQLLAALSSIQAAEKSAGQDLGEEIVASLLRSALDSLGQIVGTIYTDDILDQIFSRFCIGK